MKTIKTLLITTAIATIGTISAQAQSWGFTLGNGAGFAYSRNGGAVGISSGGGYYNQGYGNPYGPIYYAAPQPVYYGPPAGCYPQNVNVIVRTLPYTYNTSYQISYPNRW